MRCHICLRTDKRVPNLSSKEIRQIVSFHQLHLYLSNEQFDNALVEAETCILSGIKYHHDDLRYFAFIVRGRIFHDLGLLEKSIESYLSAINIEEEEYLFPVMYSYLSEVYMYSNQNDLALETLKGKAHESISELPFDIQRSIYQNTGLCYSRMEIFDSAEVYLLLSHNIELQRNIPEDLAISSLGLANHYYDLYQDDEAFKYFHEAYDYANQTTNLDLIRDATLNMSVIYENAGEYEKSLVYRKEYEDVRDSIWNKNKIWELAETEKKTALNLKQHEIDLIEQEKNYQALELESEQQQRYLWLGLSMVALSLLGISFWFYRNSVKRNRLIEAQRKELDKLNQTKNRILSIVAHDLKSPVFTISRNNDLILNNLSSESETVQDLVKTNSDLSGRTYVLIENLLNWALDQSNQAFFRVERLPLKRILNQVSHNLIPLMKGKQIAFESEIPSDIFVSADLNSLKIIFRNIIDNAIKYTPQSGTIRITAFEEEDSCKLTISDSGIGMTKEVIDSVALGEFNYRGKDTQGRVGTGLGLRLCKSLIEKNEGEMYIESESEKGTSIILELKLFDHKLN